MEIISNVALISINETLLVQLISFLIFLYVLNRVMIRPLRGSFKERELFIKKLSEEASDYETRLAEISARIKTQEAAVIKEAHTMVHRISAEGDSEAGHILDSARQDVSRLRKETEESIRAMIANVSKDLVHESESIAVSIMEKALNRRLTS